MSGRWAMGRPTRQRYTLARPHPVRCTSFKVGYRSEAAALDGVEDQMAAGFVKPGCHLVPYVCDECREWHLANRRVVFRDP